MGGNRACFGSNRVANHLICHWVDPSRSNTTFDNKFSVWLPKNKLEADGETALEMFIEDFIP